MWAHSFVGISSLQTMFYGEIVIFTAEMTEAILSDHPEMLTYG
jgi:hypothetical protein